MGFRTFLESQQLACPEGNAMSKMKFTTDEDGITTEYSCTPLSMGPNPQTINKKRPWVITGGTTNKALGSFVYQDRSDFNCPSGYVVNEVKWELNDGTQTEADIGGAWIPDNPNKDEDEQTSGHAGNYSRINLKCIKPDSFLS
jgi:hypothetical protein